MCVCVRVYVCVYMCTCVCVRAYVYVYMCTCICVYLCAVVSVMGSAGKINGLVACAEHVRNMSGIETCVLSARQ